MLTLLLFLTSAPAADDGPGPATSETATKLTIRSKSI